MLAAACLFGLAAWPTLLVELPPFQDLPNHLATAYIVANPTHYPEFAFNGFFKGNGLLTLWLHLAGRHDLFAAARRFTVLVLGLTALAIPIFVRRFCGARRLPVAILFAWPLVHSFSVSMGFLNFAFSFALSLILLAAIDAQRERPTIGCGVAIAALAGLVWFAHPFPLAVVAGLVFLHVATRATRADRARAARALLLPLAPAAALVLLSAEHHLIKPGSVPASAATAFSYLNPWEILVHFWTDVSGALSVWGSATIVPALLLPWFAWNAHGRRRQRAVLPILSAKALAGLAAVYVALPVMLSNWWHLNCRLVPFLWAGLLVRLPAALPRPAVVALATSALVFSAATGVDYLRLDRERAELTAGVSVVPRGATLLPLMFKRARTSHFTASLAHAWGYYTVLKATSAPPLVFAAERSYPITRREPLPPALQSIALDRFAELRGTPAQVCRALGQSPAGAGCTAVWRELWRGFWIEASPRFSHLLTWAMPPEGRLMIPGEYRQIFGAGELEIYARSTEPGPPAPARQP